MSESLPLVLLGLRPTYKSDLKASSAELTYERIMRLPGQFFNGTSEHLQEGFIARQAEYLERIRPRQGKRHGQYEAFVRPDLKTTSHIIPTVH